MSMNYDDFDDIADAEDQMTEAEITEERLREIAKQFEEKGFFARLGDMFRGLSKPHSSREYKLARIELQRLAAPIVAIVVPVLFFAVLIVVTAVSDSDKETVTVEIQKIEEVQEDLQEDEPPPPEEIPEPPDDVEIVVDTPNPGPISDVTPQPSPPSNMVSVKPAPADTVAIVKSPIKMKGMVSSRNPGSIGAATRGGGSYGDANTEAAVLKALRFLKKTQRADGGWEGTIANTGLAILCFLAHGEYPGAPSPYAAEFGETVAKGMQHLVDSLMPTTDGLTFKNMDGNMYAFLIATYALCESYGMTHNPNVKEAAYRCLEYIVNHQGPTGGFDYKLNKESTRDDMSFEGWALQAIKAGKMAGLHPEGLEACIKKAIKCLQTRNFRGGGFGYTAGGGATGLTATGCLCMQLLGYSGKPEVKASLDMMRGWLPVFESKAGLAAGGPCPGSAPQYYCYYAAQCKYQAGMCPGATPENLATWQAWNKEMKALYTGSMTTAPDKMLDAKGREVEYGWWEKGYNGKTMGTCLCALQLMVYYRYLPTTQAVKEQASDDDEGGAATKAASKENEVGIKIEI